MRSIAMTVRALVPLAVLASLAACRPPAGADDAVYSIVVESTTVRMRMRRADLPASWTCRALVPPRDWLDTMDAEDFAEGFPRDVVDRMVVCPLPVAGDPANVRRVYLFADRVVQVLDQEWRSGDGRAIGDTVIGAALERWGPPETTTDSSLSEDTGDLRRTRSLSVEWPTRHGAFAMFIVASFLREGEPVALVSRTVMDVEFRDRHGRPVPPQQRETAR
jgi:hypothetical protein